MNKEEKEILKKVIDNRGYSVRGIESEHLYETIGENRNHKIIDKLISEGYIDESIKPKGNFNFLYYRATQKAYAEFYSFYKKIWFFIGGDIRSVIISSITAVIIFVIIEIIKSQFK